MAVTPTQEPKGAPRPRRGLGTGRKGPIRKSLDVILREARGNGRMTAEHELIALIAERLASLADRCASDDDGPGFRNAARDLRDLVDTLPVRTPEGVTGDGATPGAELLQLYRTPPTVGDTSHA